MTKNKLQSAMAIASFSSGVIIATVCLFVVEPIGEISNSAISVVSELLVLCGALLGAKSYFDTKMNTFQSEINEVKNIKTKKDGDISK